MPSLRVWRSSDWGAGDAANGGAVSGWAEHDLHVAPGTREVVEHFRFADATKLSARQVREDRLRQPTHFGGLLLVPAKGLDDLADLRCKLHLHHRLKSWRGRAAERWRGVSQAAASLLSTRRRNSSSSRLALLRRLETSMPRADNWGNSALRPCSLATSTSSVYSSSRRSG